MSLGAELKKATTSLREAGCEAAADDAIAIFASVLGIDPPHLSARVAEPLSDANAAEIAKRIERRRNRVPLAYILGWCSFRGLHLFVDSRVLVPDDGADQLTTLALQASPGSRVHDVGTGSGAIPLALKHERPDLSVTGSDLSQSAIEVARANAKRLRLDVHFTVASGLPPGDYDLVTAILPFLAEGRDFVPGVDGKRVPATPEYTVHMPHTAVYGGSDGLAIIRPFLQSVPVGTRVVLEHPPGDADYIQTFFADASTRFSDDRAFTIGQR